MTTALYIGRFQPFHKGHLQYIKQILSKNNKIVIVIGSAQKRNTKQNPFSAEQRKQMIKLSLHNYADKIKIEYAKDYPGDNDKWLQQILKKVDFDIVYAGENQLVKNIFQEAGFTVRSMSRIKNISATRIRQLMREGKPWNHLVPDTVYEYIRKIYITPRQR